MRHEDAALALWVAGDGASRERSATNATREAALAAKARGRQGAATARQRAGAAVIALGERLAGQTRPVVTARPARRLAGQR